MEAGIMSEHLQSAMRLGSGKDIYYYGRESLHKQSIPTVVDNRFIQALNNLRQGSSTFIISVDQGVSDVMLAAKLPAQGGSVNYTDLGLPRGWLYDLIDRVSVRYAGSSQYFWLGSQLRIENAREMPNPETRDALLELGGAAMLGSTSSGAGTFTGDNLYAYAYINLPHNSPNGSLAKPNPFPSEMLMSPIVITVEMKYLPSIFSSAVASGSLAGAPQELEDAWFQVKQVHANDRGDLMVATADRTKAYSFPTKCFYQNEITVDIPAGQTDCNVLLTGFRNGQVRSIIFWITDNDDTNPVTSDRFVKNFTDFILPRDVELLYNGTVYYNAKATSSQFWNLVSSETPSTLEATVLSLSSNDLVSTPAVKSWVEIPFGQVYEQLSGSHMYVAGKTIQNAVVNLSFTLPAALTNGGTLHAMYSYNCVIMCADGSASYVF
jgi:hypothetical protein